jgi:predicted DNA-binding ribbon-helix-helix protein
MTAMVLKNVKIACRRTSVRLEEELWQALDFICERERITRDDLCTRAFDRKPDGASLASSIRVLVVEYYRAVAAGRYH